MMRNDLKQVALSEIEDNEIDETKRIIEECSNKGNVEMVREFYEPEEADKAESKNEQKRDAINFEEISKDDKREFENMMQRMYGLEAEKKVEKIHAVIEVREDDNESKIGDVSSGVMSEDGNEENVEQFSSL
jgi:hypothetical protein